MTETIELGEVSILLTRKDVKNVHLTVHPPDGQVTMTAPAATRMEVARAYAITRLGWIRAQREKFASQAREPARQFIERESHYLWGLRHLLTIEERDAAPFVSVDHKKITLTVPLGATLEDRTKVMHTWHKGLMHAVVPPLIRKWEPKLNVKVSGYFLQKMKTRWGSCNPQKSNIRLNTELVKKPKELLEYVIVHEMTHLLEPTHNARFVHLLSTHWPHWQEARAELNALPLPFQNWRSSVQGVRL